MSYTIFVKSGRVVRDSDGLQILPYDAPTQSPEVEAYKEWVENGGVPTVNNSDPEELSILAAKEQRREQVAALKVTTQAGRTYDADETSQDRMARSLTGLEDGATIQWVLADNSVATIPKAELQEAMQLAVAATTAIWVAPYQ